MAPATPHGTGSIPADPLAALRPLHEPPPIPWWPPAPGWWLLLVLALISIAMMVWLWRRNRVRRAALAELDGLRRSGIAITEQAAQLNQLLKRWAIHCWPNTNIGALSGEHWLRFLDAHAGRPQFAKGAGRALLTLPYGADADSADVAPLYALVREWIRHNRRGTPLNGVWR